MVLLAESFLERNGTLLQILVTLALAAITGVVGFLSRRRDKRSKTLDYQLLDDDPLFTRPPANAGELKVTFRGVDVSNPRLTRIAFKNTGTEVIDRLDILQPIVVKRRNAKLLDYRIHNEDLVFSLERFGGNNAAVNIHPDTLNPGDIFGVQLFYDCSGDEPVEITSRIKGQTSSIKEDRAYKRRAKIEKTLQLVPTLAFFVLAGTWVAAGVWHETRYSYGIGVMIANGLLSYYTGAQLGKWSRAKYAGSKGSAQ